MNQVTASITQLQLLNFDAIIFDKTHWTSKISRHFLGIFLSFIFCQHANTRISGLRYSKATCVRHWMALCHWKLVELGEFQLRYCLGLKISCCSWLYKPRTDCTLQDRRPLKIWENKNKITSSINSTFNVQLECSMFGSLALSKYLCRSLMNRLLIH